MRVYVVLETTGTAHEVDGAFVIGVFTTATGAQGCIDTAEHPEWCEVSEWEVECPPN